MRRGRMGSCAGLMRGKFHKKVSLKMGVEGGIRDLSVRSVAWGKWWCLGYGISMRGDTVQNA